jgi:DNA-binding beta-propeller fold protein YncE
MRNIQFCLCIAACSIASTVTFGQSTILVSDSNGVAGATGDKVARFTYPQGDVVNHFTDQEWSPVSNTTGIVQNLDGDILIASSATNSVHKYDATTGQYLGVLIPTASSLHGPVAMAVGPDGTLYVANSNSDTVTRHDSSTGQFLGILSAMQVGGGVGELAVSPADGYLYVVRPGFNRVDRLDVQTGQPVGGPVQGLLSSPHGIAFNDAGDMYVSNQRHIVGESSITYRHADFAATGLPTIFGAPLSFVPPNIADYTGFVGLEINDAGAVLVAERVRGRVLKFEHVSENDPSGVFVETIIEQGLGGLNGAYGILLYDHLPSLADDPCPADLNNDGELNFFDVSQFLNLFSAGCP